jgi:hypothetical protein
MGPMDIPQERWAATYGFFYLIQSGFDANELPLVKALHGEEVDNVKYLSKIIKNPEGIFVVATARPLQHSSGEITGGVLVIHDITERKVSEK